MASEPVNVLETMRWRRGQVCCFVSGHFNEEEVQRASVSISTCFTRKVLFGEMSQSKSSCRGFRSAKPDSLATLSMRRDVKRQRNQQIPISLFYHILGGL